jgi:hypothetical protein
MKKRIEIEFDGKDNEGFSEKQILDLNRVLTKAIYAIHEFSNPKKVTVDGNVFWLRGSESRISTDRDCAESKRYPVHHEEPVVMSVPSRLNR